MVLLKKLTKKNLKLNKKRTVVTIIGIILATSLLTAVATFVTSFRQSLIEYYKEKEGDYHYSFQRVPEGELDKIRKNRNIDSYYETAGLGYAILEGCVNVDKPYVYVEAMDKGAFENSSLNLKEGRLPENENELVISNHIKTNGGVTINIGDNICLELGKRYDDDFLLNQDNPYLEGETLEQTVPRNFTVVGICDRLSFNEEQMTAPGYTVVTCLTESMLNHPEEFYDGMDIYARFTRSGLKNKSNVLSKISGIDETLLKKMDEGDELSEKELEEYGEQMSEAVNIVPNSRLLEFETLSFNNGIMSVIYNMAIVVLVIIIVTSAFCISNSFSISVSEKMKQYGMLASVGATPRQILRNVYYEAFVLGIISIPIGAVVGMAACYILLKVVGGLVGSYINVPLIFSPSFAGILGAFLLSVVTIYFSARRPAKRAAKVSPIVAISGTNEIRLKQKKLKSPVIIKKIFGVGGVLAYKNRKRNKRKYRVAVISITVSVTVFVALYGFMDLIFATADYYAGENYNLSVYMNGEEAGSETISRVIEALGEMDDVNEFSVLESEYFNICGDIKFSSEYKYDRVSDMVVYTVGEAEYEKYVKKLGLSVDEAKQGAILVNNSTYYDEKLNKDIFYKVFDYEPGDVISIVENTGGEGETQESAKEMQLKLAAVTEERPLGREKYYYPNGLLIVPEGWFEENMPDRDEEYMFFYVDCEDADELQDLLVDEYNIPSTSITNRDQARRQDRSLYMVVAIFLYGFMAVISLIGVTNIFNTITTSMELRSREFAMLRSIGMTKREFNRMVGLESVFYGGFALVLGLLFGNILYLLLYHILASNLELRLRFPVVGIIIAVAAVFVLLYSIMKYSIAQIRKQNIIETIRQENI